MVTLKWPWDTGSCHARLKALSCTWLQREIVPFKYFKGLKHHKEDLGGDGSEVVVAERAGPANISLPNDNTHTHTSLLSWSLLVNTFDNYNLHCICYNWLLSLETVGSEPLFAVLWATTVLHLRQKKSRLDSALITPRQEKHRTLKPGRLPRCDSYSMCCHQ